MLILKDVYPNKWYERNEYKRGESAGVYDLMALAVMSPAVLADTAGVGQAVARKAIQAARDLLELGFQAAIGKLLPNPVFG
jgi:hypothetical protein